LLQSVHSVDKPLWKIERQAGVPGRGTRVEAGAGEKCVFEASLPLIDQETARSASSKWRRGSR
jgi:hypothetical protein